jgi:glycosyltransferase involved in cell wall biosynthesis
MKFNVFYFNTNLSRIATSPQDFVDRFSMYADALRKESGDTSVRIHLIVSGLPDTIHENSLKICPVPQNWLLQLHSLFRILKVETNPITLISGDNDLSLLLCLIIKCFLPRVNIQISIHSSYDSIFRSRGGKAFLKRRLLRLGLKRVKSVRIVSENDRIKFQGLTSDGYTKVFVAPIPIRIPTNIVNIKTKSKVGIVGRLHKERGLIEMASIIQKMDQQSISADFLIVGNGAEENWFKSRLLSLSHISSSFLGHLNQDELSMLWGEIKVLLSCAPLESYGMALREALANGVFVVAKKNDVTDKLAMEFPELMKTFSFQEDAVRMICEALSQTPSRDKIKKVREDLSKQQQEYLSRLALSWIN